MSIKSRVHKTPQNKTAGNYFVQKVPSSSGDGNVGILRRSTPADFFHDASNDELGKRKHARIISLATVLPRWRRQVVRLTHKNRRAQKGDQSRKHVGPTLVHNQADNARTDSRTWGLKHTEKFNLAHRSQQTCQIGHPVCFKEDLCVLGVFWAHSNWKVK